MDVRHALSRQTINQPSCPSGTLHALPSLGGPCPLPSAENSSARLPQLPPPPYQPTRTIHALLPGRPPPGLAPRPLRRRSTCCPWKPRLQASPGNPGHEVCGFPPPAPPEVTPVWLSPGSGALVAMTGLSTLPPGPGGGRATHLPAPLPGRPPGGAPLSPTRRWQTESERKQRARLRAPLRQACPGPLPAGTPTKPEPLPRAPGLAYPSVPARFLPEG